MLNFANENYKILKICLVILKGDIEIFDRNISADRCTSHLHS